MKHCFDRGILQAYLDGELDIMERKAVEQHLLNCPDCRQTLDVLKANDDFAFAKIDGYKSYVETKLSSAGNAAQAGLRSGPNSFKLKGVVCLMRRYRNVAAAACIIIALTASVTIKPVRAALSNALMIFRVEDVKTIRLSLQDLEEIRARIESKAPEIDLAKFGKVKLNGGEMESLTVDETKKLPDFQVVFPQNLTGQIPDIGTVSSLTLDLALKTANVNSILQSLGSSKFLPDNLDGKVFRIHFSRVVNLQYSLGNQRQVRITQLKSPELFVPNDVDVDELYNALVELPVFPADLRSQLRSIRDWKNTLYLPVVDGKGEMTEVRLNGNKAFINTSNRHKRRYTSMVWLDQGIIHTLSGNIEPTEAINIAGSMK
jgi:hypothetical protein